MVRVPSPTAAVLAVVGCTVMVQSAFAIRPGVPVKHGPEEEYLKLLHKYDKNGDGFITLAEYAKKPEKFKELDKNGDGKLDKPEIKAWAKEREEKDKEEKD